jgi:small subunit ribosomal protein S2
LNYPIPGNDDSLKSIRIIVEVILDAIQAGLAQRAQPETIPTRTVTPIIEAPMVEGQIPVTALRSSDHGDDIPESFSSDDSDN